jgi:hypothetical protein
MDNPGNPHGFSCYHYSTQKQMTESVFVTAKDFSKVEESDWENP